MALDTVVQASAGGWTVPFDVTTNVATQPDMAPCGLFGTGADPTTLDVTGHTLDPLLCRRTHQHDPLQNDRRQHWLLPIARILRCLVSAVYQLLINRRYLDKVLVPISRLAERTLRSATAASNCSALNNFVTSKAATTR